MFNATILELNVTFVFQHANRNEGEINAIFFDDQTQSYFKGS